MSLIKLTDSCVLPLVLLAGMASASSGPDCVVDKQIDRVVLKLHVF